MQRKRRIVRATATTALTTSLTVDAGVELELSQIAFCNTTGIARTVTLKVGGLALYAAKPLSPGETYTWTSGGSTGHMLHAGDALEIQADANSAVNVHISGNESRTQ